MVLVRPIASWRFIRTPPRCSGATKTPQWRRDDPREMSRQLKCCKDLSYKTLPASRGTFRRSLKVWDIHYQANVSENRIYNVQSRQTDNAPPTTTTDARLDLTWSQSESEPSGNASSAHLPLGVWVTKRVTQPQGDPGNGSVAALSKVLAPRWLKTLRSGGMQCTVNRGGGELLTQRGRRPVLTFPQSRPGGGGGGGVTGRMRRSVSFSLSFFFPEECKERELTSSAFIFHKGAGWPQIVFKSGGKEARSGPSRGSPVASRKGC